MKNRVSCVLMTGILSAVLSTGCAGRSVHLEQTESTVETTAAIAAAAAETAVNSDAEEEEEPQESMQIVLFVNGTELSVTWEDNETVGDLKQALENGEIIVDTHQYGGFEQVGSLPREFVRNDVQMTTNPGDIVLYAGDSIVFFYGSNSWPYTKLGHIENLSAEELRNLLAGESVQAVFRLE